MKCVHRTDASPVQSRVRTREGIPKSKPRMETQHASANGILGLSSSSGVRYVRCATKGRLSQLFSPTMHDCSVAILRVSSPSSSIPCTWEDVWRMYGGCNTITHFPKAVSASLAFTCPSAQSLIHSPLAGGPMLRNCSGGRRATGAESNSRANYPYFFYIYFYFF